MFEKWFTQDLQEKITVHHCESVVFEGDSNSYLVGVHVTDGGVVPTLTGTVSCHVIRPDNATVTFNGTRDGADVSAILPKSALTYPGAIAVVLQVVNGSDIMTVLKAIFTAEQTTTNTIVDPGNVIPSIEELLDKIDEMEEGTERANAAAAALEDMTVSASAVSGSTPTATVSTVSGHYNIAFGLVPSSISSQVTTYQNSTSGNTVPTGTWQDTQPVTPQGQYLWTKTVITWNNSQTTTLYSVSRQGIDGAGSVSSVNGESPDANGNVQLPVDATPIENSTALVESGGVYAAINPISTDVNSLKTRMTTAEGDIDTLEGTVSTHGYDIADLGTRMGEVESAVAAGSPVVDVSENLTVTLASGSCTVIGKGAWTCGNIVTAYVNLRSTASISAGATFAELNVSGIPAPVVESRAVMYNSTRVVIGNYFPAGNITVRNLVATMPTGNETSLTFVYFAAPEVSSGE